MGKALFVLFIWNKPVLFPFLIIVNNSSMNIFLQKTFLLLNYFLKIYFTHENNWIKGMPFLTFKVYCQFTFQENYSNLQQIMSLIISLQFYQCWILPHSFVHVLGLKWHLLLFQFAFSFMYSNDIFPCACLLFVGFFGEYSNIVTFCWFGYIVFFSIWMSPL